MFEYIRMYKPPILALFETRISGAELKMCITNWALADASGLKHKVLWGASGFFGTGLKFSSI